MKTTITQQEKAKPQSTARALGSGKTTGPIIQPKLNIGKPNDRYEREADQVADRVVNHTNTTESGVQKMEDEEIQQKPISSIQRKPEEEIQSKHGPLVQTEEKEALQMKSNENSQTASANTTRQINNSKGSGSPLPLPVRQEMESGIGANFSEVRVHTDTRAQNLSTQLNAQAFTVGNDVYFNKGKYNPESYSGKHLLAHELTHTVQQGAARKVQRKAAPNIHPISSSSTGIQRSIFINKQHVPANSPLLKTPEEVSLANDHLIRDFEDTTELGNYISKSTRYIGNLENPGNARFDGTWVRFSKTGTNILGENHSKVTLSDCLSAVGEDKSFIRERFTDEDLSHSPLLEETYNQANQKEFDKHGIGSEPDKHRFGLEPLEPKIGQAMAKLSYALYVPTEYDKLKASNNSKSKLGMRMVYLLKYAWAYASDLANLLAKKVDRGESIPKEAGDFWGHYAASITYLIKFIPTLDDTRYIADQIDQASNSDKIKPALQKFCESLAIYVIEKNDLHSTWGKMFLYNSDHHKLPQNSAKPDYADAKVRQDDRNESFNQLREKHIAKSLEKGINRHVRYIGLGGRHFRKVKGEIQDNRAHFYNMAGSKLMDFFYDTQTLKKKVP